MLKTADKKKKGHLFKKTGLYPRERLMLKKMSEGLTPTEAVEQVYNVSNRHSASTIAGRVFKRERFQKELEKVGLTNSFLAKKFKELMEAKRPVIIKGKLIDFPDGAVQHAALRTALKVKDLIPKDEEETSFHDEPLIVNAIQFKTQIVTS